MLSKLISFTSLNCLYYLIGFIILIPILIWLFIELHELKIARKCKQQNLKYVRVPAWNLVVLFGKRFDQIISDKIRKHGKVFGFNMWNELTISVSHPELVQIICNREFTKFPNRRNMTTDSEIWNNLLFVASDDKWKRLRAIVSPTFSSSKLRKVKPCLDDTIKVMINHLSESIEKNPVINVRHVFGSFALDSIIQISMGIKIDSVRDPNNIIIENIKKIFGEPITFKDLTIFALGTAFPGVTKLLGLQIQPDAFNFLIKMCKDIIERKRKEVKNYKGDAGKATNFIELILEIEQEQNETLDNDNKSQKYITSDELIAQCVTFFIAGFDTTSSALLIATYLLAANPDKQEKLYNSINDTLKRIAKEKPDNCDDPYELVNFDTLNKFEYLNAVLNESMRVLTLVFAIDRVATEDVRLETSDKKIWFDVKKGNVIRIPPIDLHNDPDNFFNPHEFIPERFLPENSNNDIMQPFNKMAFIPFGSGPRKCIATNLALIEAKMALIHLFRKYRFSLNPKTKLDFFVVIDALIPRDTYLSIKER